MPILELRDLHRDFGGVKAVDGVHLFLEPGELRALVGPNGCGKSTLFNLITGAFKPSSGRILFDGADIAGLPSHTIARLGVGRKFQVPSVFAELTVAENLALGGWAASRVAPSAVLHEFLERAGLDVRAGSAAATLGHGQRQWLEIAMVLAASPRLVLLDEPTAGMTFAETDAAVEMIRAVAAPADVTVLVIEHDVGFLEKLGCPVTVMARGRILRTASYGEIRADPRVHELYFGTHRADA